MALRKFGSPHLYVQGAGALDELPAVVEQSGRIPLLVADSVVLGLFRERIAALLGSDVSFAEFSGECTAEEIDKGQTAVPPTATTPGSAKEATDSNPRPTPLKGGGMHSDDPL